MDAGVFGKTFWKHDGRDDMTGNVQVDAFVESRVNNPTSVVDH